MMTKVITYWILIQVLVQQWWSCRRRRPAPWWEAAWWLWSQLWSYKKRSAGDGDDCQSRGKRWFSRRLFCCHADCRSLSAFLSILLNASKEELQVGGEQRRNQEFRFRFRQCRYRNFWQEKTGKFVNLWIDFREDIFPVYFYSESESYSLKSIQRITNSLAFSCQKFRYRHCRNRNRNSWFLLCSPPRYRMLEVSPICNFIVM